jgi:hypothetical protein
LDTLLGADAMQRAEWADEVELLLTEAFVSDTRASTSWMPATTSTSCQKRRAGCAPAARCSV